MKNWLRPSGANHKRDALDAVRRSLRGAILFPLACVVVLCSMAFLALTADAQYIATRLVSSTNLYQPVNIDPNLVDGWGLAALPDGPWWVSDQNTSSRTLYNADGSVFPMVINIPCVTDNSGTTTVPCPFPGDGFIFEPGNPGNPKGNTGIGLGLFGPTGIVANRFPNSFKVNGASAQFIFATQDGLIVAWTGAPDGVVAANRFGALYSGLAIAGPALNPHLYATNTVGGIDVFDQNFKFVNSFVPEPNLAANHPKFKPAPYGVQVIGDKLYVTYFSFTVVGGVLDVCNLHKNTINPTCRRLFASNLSGGENAPILATPWGIALAPDNFGPLSKKLLVGNVQDGLINGFDPKTGEVVGTLNLTNGSRFSVPGLWSLQFGHGSPANGSRKQLFFSSGPSPVSITDPVQQYGAGLFGVITLAAPK